MKVITFLFFYLFYHISYGQNRVNIAPNNELKISDQSCNSFCLKNLTDGIFADDQCVVINPTPKGESWIRIRFEKGMFIRIIRILTIQNLTQGISGEGIFVTGRVKLYPKGLLVKYCGKVRGQSLSPSKIIRCETDPQFMNDLVIHRNSSHTLKVCEVEVWSFQSIAINSSWIKMANAAGNSVSYLVDGFTVSNSPSSCSQGSRNLSSWVAIDFQDKVTVYAVSTIGLENKESQLNGSIVGVSDRIDDPIWSEGTYTYCGKLSSIPDNTVRCPKSTIGKYLAIQRKTIAQEFSICEIDVFGVRKDDELTFSWLVNTENGIYQYENKNINFCNGKKMNSFNISSYNTTEFKMVIKGINIYESCRYREIIPFVNTNNLIKEMLNHNWKICKYVKGDDGYFTELDMTDTCYFECSCDPNICENMHIALSKNRSPHSAKEFRIISTLK